jgi:hypothetical protein
MKVLRLPTPFEKLDRAIEVVAGKIDCTPVFGSLDQHQLSLQTVLAICGHYPLALVW